jgi:hypothetical protein
MGRRETLYTVLDPRGQPSGIFGRTLTPESQMMSILDPFSQPEITLKPSRMATRLGTLDNKTVYLVDTGFAGSHEFLEEVQGWFARNMPSVKTVLHRKKTSMFNDEPVLWVKLKKEADGVVFGVGG